MTHIDAKHGRAEAPGRSEDARLLKGQGRFTADLSFPNMAYAVLVRAPYGHADIVSIDTAEAAKAPGVLAVYTAADFPELEGIPCTRTFLNRDGSEAYLPVRQILARERVRHVGEPVAAVIAESESQAADAADLVAVDYQPLPALGRPGQAYAEGAPAIWDVAPDNICLDWETGDAAAVEAAFEEAAHRITLETLNNRVMVSAMEPRAAIGTYDGDRFTLYACSQGVMTLHGALAEHVLKVPGEKLRIVTGDVGGGFGMKTQAYPEYPIVLKAAEKLRRPVKWVATRSESFQADNSARDSLLTAEIGFDADGRILALRYHSIQGIGAYPSASGPSTSTRNTAMCLSGCYRIPAIYGEVKCMFTNTAPLGPYRGAGRPEAAYVIERLMDMAAEEMNIDRLELRRRNFIAPDEMPYTTPLDITYDSGEFAPILDEALALADWDGFEERRAESEMHGKIRGLGIACFLEHAGAQTAESARIGFGEDGTVILYSGAQSQGQGHINIFRTLMSEALGVAPEKIEMIQGDSDVSPKAGSTTGSRTAAVGGGAFHKAAMAVIEKAKPLAAARLECALEDIEFEDGTFRVAGTDRDVHIETIIAETPPEALDTSVDYDAAAPTYPNGCHIAEVEIDPATGKLTVERYSGIDDSGRIINHMIVDGQMHGGIAQGLGQVLMEHAIYGDDAQLLTGSYMDYAVPHADDIPDYALDFHPVPCRTNALGVKGAGESGTIAALPTLMNAVTDALASVGAPAVDMPATPEAIWKALNAE
jgi:carbon-monoxide dehydrogenase large subunit